jgi:hypothetical protein
MFSKCSQQNMYKIENVNYNLGIDNDTTKCLMN